MLPITACLLYRAGCSVFVVFCLVTSRDARIKDFDVCDYSVKKKKNHGFTIIMYLLTK